MKTNYIKTMALLGLAVCCTNSMVLAGSTDSGSSSKNAITDNMKKLAGSTVSLVGIPLVAPATAAKLMKDGLDKLEKHNLYYSPPVKVYGYKPLSNENVTRFAGFSLIALAAKFYTSYKAKADTKSIINKDDIIEIIQTGISLPIATVAVNKGLKWIPYLDKKLNENTFVAPIAKNVLIYGVVYGLNYAKYLIKDEIRP